MSFTSNIDSVVTDWYADKDNYDLTWYVLHRGEELHRAMLRLFKNNDLKKHIYMVTFTLKPCMVDAWKDAEKLIIDQSDRTALKIIEFQYVREKTKKGVYHWHALIVTSKPLKKDRFNYYIQKYGNVDIAKNKAQQTSEILNYLTKTGNLISLK